MIRKCDFQGKSELLLYAFQEWVFVIYSCIVGVLS